MSFGFQGFFWFCLLGLLLFKERETKDITLGLWVDRAAGVNPTRQE